MQVTWISLYTFQTTVHAALYTHFQVSGFKSDQYSFAIWKFASRAVQVFLNILSYYTRWNTFLSNSLNRSFSSDWSNRKADRSRSIDLYPTESNFQRRFIRLNEASPNLEHSQIGDNRRERDQCRFSNALQF